MKLAKLVPLLIVGLALSLGGTACRKNLDKVTNIPGQPPARPGDTAAGPIGSGTPIDPANPGGTGGVTGDPTRGTGIPPAGGDFTGWKEDRETFHADIVYFDFDQSTIKASEVSKLQTIARRMKSEFPGKALRIEGNCDQRGTEEYNRALGDRRALSAREYLVREGLDANMLPTVSYGKDRLTDPANTAAAWTKNRRCEFVVLSPP